MRKPRDCRACLSKSIVVDFLHVACLDSGGVVHQPVARLNVCTGQDYTRLIFPRFDPVTSNL